MFVLAKDKKDSNSSFEFHGKKDANGEVSEESEGPPKGVVHGGYPL